MNIENMNSTLELVNNIQTSQKYQDIDNNLEKLTDMIHCEYYLFAIINPKSMIKSDVLILDNYPKQWRDYYDEENLIKYDPIVDYCLSNHSPISWHIFDKKTQKKSKPNVIKEAKTSGLHSGFSFPIHTINGGFGMISFAHSNKGKNIDYVYSNACMNIPPIIPALLDSYHRINQNEPTSSTYLTKREKECLSWACEGKSSWEISKILGCAERTVTFHLTNSQTKLGTNNRCQSVSKAILTGAINPSY
ncbi:transcriptional regulator [Aliivibrio sifiae]|uniref:Transcriptional activator protein LuxR n=2 Tax=Aliivibrio sifiae TaxID=566293 RepID=A0A2S7X782_9GAMM|nr:transcriptional regulator [Aliivibrio sifiae]GLR73874.1 transcriptional activator protein LuxR [Aliivibrio sifiae]